MDDFTSRGARGSPPWEDIEREGRSRDGQPFDDSNLKAYLRTIFNYALPDGRVLYQQCRYDYDPKMLKRGVDEPRKKFLVRRPIDTNGNYVFGVGGRRIIYNYSRVLSAGPGALVFVTEGESNADALVNANLLATCVISNKWTDECAAALTGYDCLVLEDHDEHGKKNAARAVAALTRHARSIRLVTAAHLWKHLGPEHAGKQPPETADVGNWIEMGGDVSQLRQICLEVPADGGPITAEPYDFPKEQDIASYQWLYGRHVLRGEVSGTAAMGGTGKSNMAIVEALAMATGRQLLHDSVPQHPLRVVLVNLEDNRNTMGHVNIYATYWYLEATADLMRDVAAAGEEFITEGRQS